MANEKRLIELIGNVQYLGGLEEKLAAHLIANDVVPVVRCENCEHVHRWKGTGGGEDRYSCLCEKGLPSISADDFCPHGKRREENNHEGMGKKGN